MSELTRSLIITAIGMGLVFLTIIVLWALMSLLTVFGGRPRRRSEAQPIAPGAGQDRAAQAAALAVAIALAEQEQSSIRPFPLPQTTLVSAWQLGRRSENLNKQGKVR